MNYKKVNKIIKAKKWSQNETARQTGIDISIINKLVNGANVNLTTKNIIKLAKALEVNVGDIFEDIVK